MQTLRDSGRPHAGLVCLGATRFFVALVLSALAVREVRAAPLRIFVTSVSGTANLSTWPDAQGATGLAAGDKICRARATAAGLPDPQMFVAWLSDSTTDAWCHAHGLTGKKAANCGQPSLPANAGPWLRVDGYPFGETLGAIVDLGVVYTPVRLDELGHDVAAPPYFTGTESNGALDPVWGSCLNWTSGSNSIVMRGEPTRTTTEWTNASGLQCSMTNRLLCLQAGPGDPLPRPFAASGRTVFVTSTTGTAVLATWPGAAGAGGIAAADNICRARATAVGLPHAATFKAWISDQATNAVDRLLADGPWVRPDGVPVATTKADLTDGSYFTSIGVTELGTYLGKQDYWTGTSINGLKSPSTCSGWTSTSSFGTTGRTNFAGASAGADQCSSPDPHLACFSDEVVLAPPALPVRIGGSVTLAGSAITPTTVLKAYIATATGPVDVLPGGLAPDATTSTTWTGTLPWPWPAAAPSDRLLGNGFVALSLIAPDRGFDESDAVGAVLLGDAARGVPSITSLDGWPLSASSSDVAIGVANVEGLLVPGATFTIGGEGFVSPVVNLFTAVGNFGPLTPVSSTPTTIVVQVPLAVPAGPGSVQVVDTTDFATSNAVSIPVGETIQVATVAMVGNEVHVYGAGFNGLTVVNLFAARAGAVVNAGGLLPGGAPRVPLTVVDSHELTFTRPAALDSGPAYVQAINPPFIPYTSSGTGAGGAFELP